MQPQSVIFNNFSPALLAARAKWEGEQGIVPSELLTFRRIGTGQSATLRIKGTGKGNENSDFTEMPAALTAFFIPSQESILDPGTRQYLQLAYFKGGWSPGKTRESVRFGGPEETTLTVTPDANPDLYDFLTFSPRLKDGCNPSRDTGIVPSYELLRPLRMVETNWRDRQKHADVITAIGTATLESLQYLAPKISLPAQTATEEKMRDNFAAFADRNSANVERLAQLLAADETLVFQNVEKAIAAEVVQVNPDKMMWVLTSTQAIITPASADRNTLNQLVDYLLLEGGQSTYKQILLLTQRGGQSGSAPAPAAPAKPFGRK